MNARAHMPQNLRDEMESWYDCRYRANTLGEIQMVISFKIKTSKVCIWLTLMIEFKTLLKYFFSVIHRHLFSTFGLYGGRKYNVN